MPTNWHQLDLRQLIALQTIADAGSFWAAADRLDCTQSGLSQQIAALERTVGQRLIERNRGRRRLAITEAGQLLLHHTTAIVARLQAAHADLSALASGATGTVRVGTFESSGTRILPETLRRFRHDWPSVDVRLTETAKDDDLLVLVERGEVDLSFALFPLPAGPFEAVELLRDPWMVVVPAGSPVGAGEGAPTLSDLDDVPLITFGQGRSLEQVEGYLRSRGVKLRIGFRSNYNGTLQSLARAGAGTWLAPLLTVDRRDPGVRVVGPLADLPPRIIAMAWHRDRYRSPAAQAFLKTTRSVCSEWASVS